MEERRSQHGDSAQSGAKTRRRARHWVPSSSSPAPARARRASSRSASRASSSAASPRASICALTFTNKAAGEMAERVATLVKERQPRRQAAKGLAISTFHSFGLMVARHASARRSAARSRSSIRATALGVVKEILRRDGRRPTNSTRPRSSRASRTRRTRSIDPEDYAERRGRRVRRDRRRSSTRATRAALRSFRAFDFDDLVCEVARLWKDARGRARDAGTNALPSTSSSTSTRTRTARSSSSFGSSASAHKNICVVGDDDQSIYAGAAPTCATSSTSRSTSPARRSSSSSRTTARAAPILAVANAVIAKRTDVEAQEGRSSPTKPGGEKVRRSASRRRPRPRPRYVAREMPPHRSATSTCSPKDIAILYRSNGQAQARSKRRCASRASRYRVIGGQQFFERKEVKDLLAYLKLALNRADEIASAASSTTRRAASASTSLESSRRTRLARAGRSGRRSSASTRSTASAERRARRAASELERVDRRGAQEARHRPRARERRSRAGSASAIGSARTSTTASASQRRARAAGATSRARSGCSRAARRASRNAGGDPTSEDGLRMFLHALTLAELGRRRERPRRNVVTLSTLHGSKGLEFDTSS